MVTYNKYTRFFYFFISVIVALSSCSTNEEFSEDNSENSELSCTAHDKIFADGMSRSSLTFDASRGMVFTWNVGDAITVFAEGDYSAAQRYNLKTGGGTPSAKFVSDNFRLVKDKLYYSVSKAQDEHISLPDLNNVLVNYAGQTQVGNADTKHLGSYDFMVSGQLCTNDNTLSFEFKHLGSTLRVVMGNFQATAGSEEKQALDLLKEENDAHTLRCVRFTEMEIYDSENSFRQPNRYFSFLTGTEGRTYTLKWPEQEITSMERFKLNLVNASTASDARSGISRFDEYNDGSATAKNQIITYMEIPPVDFRNKTIAVMLKGYYEKKVDDTWQKVDVSYVGEISGNNLNILAGEARQFSFSMKKPSEFKVTLKINHMWQHGSTLDQSRASTGDPGNDKEIVTPKYLYYIYCVNGKVIKPQAGATGCVTTITQANWVTNNIDGAWISTYKDGIITLQKPNDANTFHLYVVASESALTISDISAGTDEETVVRELKYNIGGTDAQVFMRDLYSTPWDADDFSGNITDPIQDVILYHVAAKVDLKWNSSTAIKTISVNKVKNTGLYLFKPTENVFDAEGGYTASHTFNDDNEMDQQYNGRYVFYLPQFQRTNCTYNVTLGSGSPENITFYPLEISTYGGFTSWLRWLKKK